MKNKTARTIIVLIIIALFFISCNAKKHKKIKAEINNKTYSFELAATDQERKEGLMFRKKLNKNSGMLFVYSRKGILSYYMKNTMIKLDIAFLDENFIIVDIQEMQPFDETTIISKDEAQYALEANRGFFKRIGLKIGSKIQFISPIPYLTN